MNGPTPQQRAAALYETLDPQELGAVARCCSLEPDDVRQEAWAHCLAITTGRSDHDPTLGSVRQYVMGHLWGLTLRWQASLRLGCREDGDTDEIHAPGDLAWEHALLASSPYTLDPEATDPVQVLLAREAEQAYEAACRVALDQRVATGELTEGERTFLELIHAGAPPEELSELYGLTPRALRYRCDRLRRKLEGAKTNR